MDTELLKKSMLQQAKILQDNKRLKINEKQSVKTAIRDFISFQKEYPFCFFYFVCNNTQMQVRNDKWCENDQNFLSECDSAQSYFREYIINKDVKLLIDLINNNYIGKFNTLNLHNRFLEDKLKEQDNRKDMGLSSKSIELQNELSENNLMMRKLLNQSRDFLNKQFYRDSQTGRFKLNDICYFQTNCKQSDHIIVSGDQYCINGEHLKKCNFYKEFLKRSFKV